MTRFGSVSGPENTGIVLVQGKNDAADGWFKSAGKSLAEVQGQINPSTKPQSFAFPDTLHMTIHVDIETTRATVNNVLAYLPGKTDEYVIVGAHYDHLGRGNSTRWHLRRLGRFILVQMTMLLAPLESSNSPECLRPGKVNFSAEFFSCRSREKSLAFWDPLIGCNIPPCHSTKPSPC